MCVSTPLISGISSRRWKAPGAPRYSGVAEGTQVIALRFTNAPEEDEMKFALLGAAALAAAALVTPAKAQEVIYNPGRCAQFYPNANCQNLGPGNPYTNRGYRTGGWRNGYAYMGHRWHHHHYHHHR
jgi:hypothetical protein